MRFDQFNSTRRSSAPGWTASTERDLAFQQAIMAIPAGKVSTYGRVAEAAGYPRYHRSVVRMLREEHSDRLPWHRVVGADGGIKTSGKTAKEQRARLLAEGVQFRGERVDMKLSLHGAR